MYPCTFQCSLSILHALLKTFSVFPSCDWSPWKCRGVDLLTILLVNRASNNMLEMVIPILLVVIVVRLSSRRFSFILFFNLHLHLLIHDETSLLSYLLLIGSATIYTNDLSFHQKEDKSFLAISDECISKSYLKTVDSTHR